MTAERSNSFRSGPDEKGHFGIFGGRYVAETLMPLILEVEKAYAAPRPIRRTRPSSTIISNIMSAGRAHSITRRV